MARLVLALFCLLFATSYARAEDGDPDIVVKGAIFAAGQTWVLTAEGELWAFAPTDFAPHAVPLEGRGMAICADGESLVLAILSPGPEGFWTLNRIHDSRTVSSVTVSTGGDGFAGLMCHGDGVTLVTTRRVIDIGKTGSRRTIRLKGDLGKMGRFSPSAAYQDDHEVFIGSDAGEWGGGLLQIDRRTGQVQVVRYRSDKGQLSGLGNVQTIITDPWKPNCALTAIGIVHFFSMGGIVRVCDGIPERFVSKRPTRGPDELAPEDETVAFYGLAKAQDTVWAYGVDGLYKLSDSAELEHQARPKFHAVGPFVVSYELPGIVALMNRSNKGKSVGPDVMTLVVRQSVAQ